VFVHYWGGSAGTWGAVVQRLPADRDTVLFDQRGWSSSRTLAGPYHLVQLADDLIDVVEGLGLDRYVLVGHSMGGKVSQLTNAAKAIDVPVLVLAGEHDQVEPPQYCESICCPTSPTPDLTSSQGADSCCPWRFPAPSSRRWRTSPTVSGSCRDASRITAM
jgi:pimeloyl-ACP methyl ester carboxylesterase